MVKLILSIFILFMFSNWMGIKSQRFEAHAQVVRDANLAAAVRQALGLATGAEIQQTDLTRLTSLSTPDSQIVSLVGLEHATNLQTLVLDNNPISSIRPILNLRGLKTLSLNNIGITDIRPLSTAGFATTLRELRLNYNAISDFNPLVQMSALLRLQLSATGMDNDALRVIAGMVLATFYIDCNEFTDLSPLPEMNLQVLKKLRIDEKFKEQFMDLDILFWRLIANPNRGPGIEPKTIYVSECSTPPVPTPPAPIPPDPALLPILDASSVAMDRVVFNELYNATDDTNDWLELKNIGNTPVSLKDWEISIVTEHTPGNPHRPDVDIVTFPDYRLPVGGILLITNTLPSETDLIAGEDITKTDSKPAGLPQYFVAPKMQLPAHRYLLILRSETDKNGKPEAFEDVAGTYLHQNFHEIVETEEGRIRVYATHVWPLQVSNPGRVAALTENEAWQRVSVSRRGYEPEAWAETGYQQGLGYKPQAARETSLGTPGYPNPIVVGNVLQASEKVDTPRSSTPGQSQEISTTGTVSFSEVMFASRGGLHSLPQWIELYNNSDSKTVNLKGWTLAIEVRDADGSHRYGTMKLHEVSILPKQTALLVTWGGRNSGHLPEDRVYHLFRHNEAFEQDINRNRVLSPSGFLLRLSDSEDRHVDAAGNLDGDQKTTDAPAWKLPAGETGTDVRTSIVRRYTDGVPVDGTAPTSWRRATDAALAAKTYWGHETDIGTPGYRKGGILPVGLSRFRSERTENGEVVISWTTASETRNAGFKVLRSRTPQGAFVQINAKLIPGAGTTSDPQTYTYQDRGATRGVVYYYRLEDVSLSGRHQHLATVRLKGHVSAGGRHLQQWAALKAQKW